MDHVFHMANIALSAWFQYLYTADKDYLRSTGYPVIKECARFFFANMIYEGDNGRMFLGKCTDLERLGPAKVNPFMTSCGAIYTLENAAQAATLLDADPQEAALWIAAAAKLHESLPRDGNRYVPYAGCMEESVAAMGGLFPYPLFDESSELQRNAAEHYLKHGRAFGNMYQMGNSVCPWYLGWMAAALARLGDRTEPARLLDEAARSAGCFGEMFEINEEKVSRTPWFSTASGNVVYALNQMLVQCRGPEIRIAPAVPQVWKDYACKLACHGDLTINFVVNGGRLARLVLEPGRSAEPFERTLVIPAELVDEPSLNPSVVKAVRNDHGKKIVEIRFQGWTALMGHAN
jgi:alpha-L-fucosidase 2